MEQMQLQLVLLQQQKDQEMMQERQVVEAATIMATAATSRLQLAEHQVLEMHE